MGEGDENSVGVEKVWLMGLLLGDGLLTGTGIRCGRKVVTLVRVAGARAPAFVFPALFVPPRGFVPSCVAPFALLLKPPIPPAAPAVIPLV